jgi:hypothetical protein
MKTSNTIASAGPRARSVSAHRQRGLGWFGGLYIFATLAIVVLCAMQAGPSYMEYQKIQKAVDKAAREATTPEAARSAFDKISTVDDIRAITGKDLSIKKGAGDRLVLGFAYDKEIPLYPPVYLTIKYAGQSK